MKFSRSLAFNAVPQWKEHYINYSQLKKQIYSIYKKENISGERCHDNENGFPSQPTAEAELLPLESHFKETLTEELARISEFYNKEKLIILQKIEGLSPSTPQEVWIETYIQLCDLQEFVALNHTGFSKILKKHDKYSPRQIKEKMMMQVDDKLKLQDLDFFIEKLEKDYSHVFHADRLDIASAELKQRLRDFVILEKSSIWRDQIERERKRSAVTVVSGLEKQKQMLKYLKKFMLLCFCCLVFVVILISPILDRGAERSCLAILILSSLLWALEIFPLFVPSFLLPLLVVTFRVLKDGNGVVYPALDASKIIFKAMMSSVIFLLLGGFSIAGVMSKYNLAKILAISILNKSGNNPKVILLLIMSIAAFMSMWISNVASPVLCFSLMEPVLKSLPHSSSYAKALILGIALSANIGGMLSPISSPQNVIALSTLGDNSPNWIEWFASAIPIGFLSILCCWFTLMLIYKQKDKKIENTPVTKSHGSQKLTPVQWYILIVSIVTIVLWCVSSQISSFVGEMGLIAVIPLVAFFGTGLLTKEDFNSFPWNIVMLAMGGMALGEAIRSSGLLRSIGSAVGDFLNSYSLFVVALVFCLLTLVFTTFMSHTAGAMIILPLVQEIGEKLPGNHSKLLVLLVAFTCSAGMGLPISSIPNMTSVSMEDQTGRTYLTTKDFAKVGVPCSVIVTLWIMTVGFGIYYAMGF